MSARMYAYISAKGTWTCMCLHSCNLQGALLCGVRPAVALRRMYAHINARRADCTCSRALTQGSRTNDKLTACMPVCLSCSLLCLQPVPAPCITPSLKLYTHRATYRQECIPQSHRQLCQMCLAGCASMSCPHIHQTLSHPASCAAGWSAVRVGLVTLDYTVKLHVPEHGIFTLAGVVVHSAHVHCQHWRRYRGAADYSAPLFCQSGV